MLPGVSSIKLPDMKLVMTLLVRDEERILRANIDFHLAQGVDFIIATDNLSVDGTRDILREYEAKGVLHYLFEAQDDYSQHAWVTRMARMACTDFAADWVINNDADEFWWPLHGDLKQALSREPEEVDGLIVERTNFVFLGDSPDRPFWRKQVYRERESRNHFGRPLPPKVAHRARGDIVVAQGNHSVTCGEGALNLKATGELQIFHFPVHCRADFRNKILTGGKAYDQNEELRNRVGRFWLESYLRAQEDPAYLDRFLDEKTLNRQDLDAGLSEGTLIQDLRLREFLSRLYTPGNN